MKAFLLIVLKALFDALFGAVREAGRDTFVDASAQKDIKKKLKDKIKKMGWCVLCCIALSGCGTRTVYIPHGEPVRLRSDVDAADVWIMTDDGPIASTMRLYEGWYCMPLEGGDDGD